MILIDALYINKSGGKVLLDYLIESLELTDKKICYLLDNRIKNLTPKIKETNAVHFCDADLLVRYKFYKNLDSRFTTILCFGNLAPNIRLKSTVYTLFHNKLYLDVPGDYDLKTKVIFALKRSIFKKLIPNSNYWILQSQSIKNEFLEKFNISDSKTLVLPFYPPFPETIAGIRKENTYVYVSNGETHKNHNRLIHAFCLFFDKYKKGALTLTISNDFPHLLELVEKKISLGYPIVNLGFIMNRNQLYHVYKEHEYLIFPSLSESFGLGIVEAIDLGCKVIGSDLPYTHAVCTPSITFNPLDENSIVEAFALSIQPNNIALSISKVRDQINTLIGLLE